MPDISQPIELSFVFGTIVVILIVTAIGVVLVRKFA